MNSNQELERLWRAALEARIEHDSTAPFGFASRIAHLAFAAGNNSPWSDFARVYRSAVACAVAVMVFSIYWSYPVVVHQDTAEVEVANAVLQMTMLP